MSTGTSRLLLDAAYEWERKAPDRVYLTQPVGDGKVVEYTWAQTMDQARRMAAHLRSLDLPAGSHIALISKNCAHFVICDLAIWMAGHATVALYPTLNTESVAYILDHSDSRLVFVGKLDDWEDIEAGIPEGMPRIALPLSPDTDYEQWDDIIARTEPLAGDVHRKPDDICLICYTSGSTGRPKGVMHSFASASIPAQHFAEGLGVNEDDRVLSYLPLAHVMERATVEFASFYSGTRIFFSESLKTFVNDLRRAQPTLFISVPRLWLKFQLGVLDKFPQSKLDRLLKIPVVRGIVSRKIRDGLGLGAVRLAGSGSAPLPADLIHWYDRIGLPIVEGYGMSEDFAYSHMSTQDKRKPGYVGIAWDNVETRISDEGEVQLKSPGNMVGYYKDPEKTAECYTEDGFFRTGDRGEYSPEGLLRITGRTKELFKTSKGKYVAPVPIENLLNSGPGVELTLVSGVGRPACFALVQLAEELRPKLADPAVRASVEADMETLLESVNREVEEFERVQFIAIVKDEWQTANGFLTPTLKIKREVIESTYEPFLDDWYASGRQVIWQE
jgi:long-subunit acyl-CoA synthetase (AMP-forming)